MKLIFAIALIGAACCRAGEPPAPAPHPPGPEDLLGIREVHDPQLSPDSRWVAYTVTSNSLGDDKQEKRVFMLPFQGGEAIALTAEGVSSDHPRWSPDGRFLAFLSERNDDKAQVYLLNMLGGEAQKLTAAIQGVEDYRWSPDGKRMVLILRDPSPEDREEARKKAAEETDEKPAAKKPKGQRPWVIDRLQFKEDVTGYLERYRTHLYVYTLADKSTVQVTSGDFDDSEPAWSPDGRRLAFVSNRSKPEPDATMNTDIWVVTAGNADKGAHPVQVTTSPGEERSPDWSPDGQWIAYTSSLDPAIFQYATKHVAYSPAGGGAAKVLTRAYDRMAAAPRFAPDGRSVYFIADDDGTLKLAATAIADGKVSTVAGGPLAVDSYSLGRDGAVALSVSTMDRPYELFALRAGKPERLSHANDEWLARHALAPGEYVAFPSKDGALVHGYVYKPAGYVAGRRYPAILRPHGGPVWAYYAEFQEQAQLFAAAGYVVLLPNPRGSSGYGEEFCKAINADWGNKDYQDDMAMVDYAIAQGYADPDKLGVGGWSYGGISTDFIIAQTRRFKGAISGAGEADYNAMWGHDMYQLYYTVELGLPWERPEAWQRVNFLRRVKEITTPTMFVGGNADWNVPILGGEQMYQSLKALGRETLLVVYPDEPHEFKTPSHIRDRNERFLAWYAHYVKADGTPAVPPAKPAGGPAKSAAHD
jgi:dipeptidyl aminopeptidase/acylaminoacyl peptidase